MKTLVLTASIALAALACHASTVEYRVFAIAGEIPASAEIIRLYENHLISPAISGSAKVRSDGRFSDRHTEAYSYPTAFTKSGEPEKTATTELGYKFTGKVKTTNGVRVISFTLTDIQKLMEKIYLHDSGKGMPTPVLARLSFETEATTMPGDTSWLVFGGLVANDGKHTFLALRLLAR